MKGRMGLGSKRSLASEKYKLKDLVAHISEQDMLLTLVDKGVQGQFFDMGKHHAVRLRLEQPHLQLQDEPRSS